MAGVSYGPFKNVNIFGLLDLNPNSLLRLPIRTVLQRFRGPYHKAILRFHPDRTGIANLEPSQQLNGFKDFLGDFRDVNPTRITKLVERGCQTWRPTPSTCLNWKPPTLRPTAAPPGSSPSNPIDIDALGASTTDLSSSSNPIVLDAFEIAAATREQGRTRSKAAARRYRNRRTYRRSTVTAYDPLRGSR